MFSTSIVIVTVVGSTLSYPDISIALSVTSASYVWPVTTFWGAKTSFVPFSK